MAPWARASELERVLACLPSQVVTAGLIGERSLLRLQKSPATKKAALWGQAMHHWKATGLLPTPKQLQSWSNDSGVRVRVPSLLHALEQQVLHSSSSRDSLWPHPGQHELSYTLRCSGTQQQSVQPGTTSNASLSVLRNVAADESARNDWKTSQSSDSVSGTADYVGDLFGVPWVDDLKTGRFAPEPDNAQNKFYALCAWLDAGEPRDGAHVSITHWPRGGSPRRLGPIAVSADCLHSFRRDLDEAYAEWVWLNNREIPLACYSPSDAICRWCPARRVCPALNPEN